MNKVIRNTTWTGIGLLLTLVSGAPALADDTELLLVDPNLVTPKPNILLIIDTSGSMGTTESTKEPYDYTVSYTGTCDPTRLYWSEVDAVPSCDPGNDRMIDKSAFLCDAATTQLQGIGIYSNKMVQYRTGSSGFWSIFGSSSSRWQKLAPGNFGDFVECEKDRGVHGDGVDASAVYPQKGGDKPPFTDDDKKEISWRSFPTSQNYYVYDGNYLNYTQNTVTVPETRIGIVQQTAKVILNSIENVNVGVMRFNSSQGGPVIAEMQDLDTNRTDLINLIDSLPSSGATPVSETLYEAALYWRGMNAHFGELINETPTDPDALVSTSPERYLAPQTEVCAKNYNVLLTDGGPVNDADTPGLAPTLPNWFGTLGRTNCTGTGMGRCLDDIAEYLSKDDIDPTMDGIQTVTTHTIGFTIDLPILKEAAEASGGEYFLADDIESLSLALMRIFTNINEEALSFAAPAVAVNTYNRTRNLNDLYMTAFNASEATRWPGNLKKYRIKDGKIVDVNDNPAVDPNTGFFYNTTRSYWSALVDGNDVEKGGAAAELPDPASRKVYVDITADPDLWAGANELVSTNTNFTLADLGLTGSPEEPTKDELIRWARGEDVQDADGDPATTVRYEMGDPLHSEPAAIVYGGPPASPDTVVYMATNEGYLHAIDGATGTELWSFIPRGHLPNLAKLYFNPDSGFKHYGIDGDIVPIIKDVDSDGVIESGDGDFVYIIFGMRRGGDVYYALDVTNKNTPKLKWTFAAAQMGQSWSAPTVAKVDITGGEQDSPDKAVVVFGAGYDTVHDTISHPATPDVAGAGVFMVDLESGDELWRAGPDAGADLRLDVADREMDRSIPNDVRVLDINADGFADRMYTADMGGQVWRFDIFNGNDPGDLVTGGVIAQLGAEGMGAPTDVDTRRFYNAPDIALFDDNVQNRKFIAINIGSGYRAHPLDTTNADRFYSIRDPDVFNKLSQTDYNGYSIITETDLVEVSGSVGNTVSDAKSGWMFTLPADQMVLADATTFNNEVFFVSFSPDAAAASTCGAGRGKNFLYRVSVLNGDPIADLSAIVSGQEDEARVTQLAQGGIAPAPRFLFPSADDPATCTGAECAPPPIYCIGAECGDPGFPNVPVRTLWTQDGVE